MSKKEVKYLLGIDGGGTKTEFLLTDISGQEIRRIIPGGSNPVNMGIENSCSVLSDGIKRICEGINYSELSVFAGIAGAKTGDNEKRINDFLSFFGFASYSVGSDIDLALELALGDGNGTAVIMGTGIVAFSRNGEKLYRTGGRGYMIDRGGSGFHFGSDALNSAFSFLDGREGSETILKLIENKLVKPLEEVAGEIYKGGPSFVASFAPVVFEAHSLGDCKAEEIIDRNAKEVADLINGALKISENAEKKVVICGGLAKQKEALCPFIKKYLADDVKLLFNTEPMVNAAVSKAQKLTGEKLC